MGDGGSDLLLTADFCDEEGDGTGGEIGHDPLQTLGGMWCLPIVARGYEDHARCLSPHYLKDPGVEDDGQKLPVTERRRPAQLQLLARTLIRRHLAQHQPVAGWPGAILVTVAHGVSFTTINSALDQQRYSQTPAPPARPGTYGQQTRP
jgi:hypothetical protein